MSLLPFRSVLDNSLGQDWLMSDPFRDEFFSGLKTHTGTDLTKPFSPLLTMDIIEADNHYKVLGDLPGVDASELEITVEKNALVIKAERKHAHDTKTDKVHRLERSYGSVQRKVLLPRNADMDNAQTSFKNGVLIVTIPKHVELPPASRKLTINTV